jgi:hypothetical protein
MLAPIGIFILTIATTLALTSTVLNYLDIRLNTIKVKSEAPLVVQSPLPSTIDFPSIAEEKRTTLSLLKLVLTPQPYVVNSDVMSNSHSYQLYSTHLLLNGSFSIAQLYIHGDVIGLGKRFLYLNYGNVGGVINGVRFSVNTLNETQTMQDGGVFTSANPIDVRLDLLSTVQLATTKNEYANNQQTSKLVNLWQSNAPPPTYINLAVAPFNEYGVFGGASLQTEFDYQCTPNAKCEAIICSASKHVYDCMKDEFGKDAALKWCRTVTCDHKNQDIRD